MIKTNLRHPIPIRVYLLIDSMQFFYVRMSVIAGGLFVVVFCFLFLLFSFFSSSSFFDAFGRLCM